MRPASKRAGGVAALRRSIHAVRSAACSTRIATGGTSAPDLRSARAPSGDNARSSAARIHPGADSNTASSRSASPIVSARSATLRNTAFANAATRVPRAARTALTASLTAANAGTRMKKSW